MSSIHYAYPVKRTTLFNGAQIAYVDEGTGPQTLLFVHGLANYAMGWHRNLEALKSQYRCIAIDLPGNGLSEGGPYPYSVSFFATCLIDFIGRMGLSNVCLIGHSMGGQVVIKAVLDAPHCAEKLVLCAPAGFEQFTFIEKALYQQSIQYAQWLSTDEASLRHTLWNSFYQFPAAAEAMIKQLTSLIHLQQTKDYNRMVDACIKSMLDEAIFTRLKEIKQPVLVLFGEQDALIPNKLMHLTTTRQVATDGTRQLKNGKLMMLARCGHFLQWEKATVVNKLITEFIA